MQSQGVHLYPLTNYQSTRMKTITIYLWTNVLNAGAPPHQLTPPPVITPSSMRSSAITSGEQCSSGNINIQKIHSLLLFYVKF